MNRWACCPTRNYQQGVFEHAELVSGEYLDEHHKVKTIACAQCPIACEQMSRRSRRARTPGRCPASSTNRCTPSARTWASATCRRSIKLIDICDEGGMDAMSAGVTISLGDGDL